MVTYADTSFLVPIYVPQTDSKRALAFMQRQTAPLPFTPFHRQELRNAVRLCVFRKEITAIACREALREAESDLENGILARAAIAWTNALQKVEELGEAYTESVGIHSLDLFHLACAIQLRADVFLTFDLRQRELAKMIGFEVEFKS